MKQSERQLEVARVALQQNSEELQKHIQRKTVYEERRQTIEQTKVNI